MLEVTSVALLAAALAARGSRGSSSSRSDSARGGGSVVGSRGDSGSAGGSSSSRAGGSRGGSRRRVRARGGGGGGARVRKGQGRAGNLVRAKVLVEVEEDAGVGLGVQGRAEGTIGQVGTGASDLQVEALGVVLGTVRAAGGVQGNDLVTDNVVAGLECRGDGNVPGEAVLDQLVRGPGSGVGPADETSLGDLDPLQRGLVDAGGVIGRGNVGDDGTVVLRLC